MNGPRLPEVFDREWIDYDLSWPAFNPFAFRLQAHLRLALARIDELERLIAEPDEPEPPSYCVL